MCSFDVNSIFPTVSLSVKMETCINDLYRHLDSEPPTVEESVLRKLFGESHQRSTIWFCRDDV